MNICQLLSPDATLVCSQLSSKKKVLEKISEIVATKTNATEKTVFESLIAREKLGSTALGNGVAIPHGRVANCDKVTTVFLLLESAIDYDAPDKKLVDIIFAIIVPDKAHEEHLSHLSSIAEILSQEKVLNKIRHSHSGEALFEIIEDAAAHLC